MRLLFLVALPLARASELTLKLGVLANASKHIASQIETLFDRAEYNTQPTSCTAYNTCAKNLPSGVCDESWGATDGCGCAGRAIDKDHVVVKGSTEVSDADEIKNVVCYTDGIEDTFKAMYDDDADGMLKWLYYGSSEGVLVNYPGFLWGVADDDDNTCSDTYDTTERDWYVMGATGPKDVILILGASSLCARAQKLAYASKLSRVRRDDWLLSTTARSLHLPHSRPHRLLQVDARGDAYGGRAVGGEGATRIAHEHRLR